MFSKMKNPDGSPLVTFTKEEVSSLQGFLELKKHLSHGNMNGILHADIVRKLEMDVLTDTNEEKFNSYLMFSVSAGIHDEDSIKQYSQHLEKTFAPMKGTHKAFFTDQYGDFEESLVNLYKDFKVSPDLSSNEVNRIILKGLLVCFYGYNKYQKNCDTAYSLLEKALSITTKEEYEYNVIRFLLRELLNETS